MVRLVLGAVMLLVGAMVGMGAAAATISPFVSKATDMPSLPMYVIALICTLVAIVAWATALYDAEGDDIFSGRRGLLLVLMVACTIGIGAFVVFFGMHADTWTDMIDGMNSANR